jgi:hypothetical protein
MEEDQDVIIGPNLVWCLITSGPKLAYETLMSTIFFVSLVLWKILMSEDQIFGTSKIIVLLAVHVSIALGTLVFPV